MERLVVLQWAQTCSKIIEMTDKIRHSLPPAPRLTDAMVGPPSLLPVLIETIEGRW